MREHRYTLDMPHSPTWIWALMQDSMRALSQWLCDHRDYRADRVQRDASDSAHGSVGR